MRRMTNKSGALSFNFLYFRMKTRRNKPDDDKLCFDFGKVAAENNEKSVSDEEHLRVSYFSYNSKYFTLVLG